LNVAKKNKEESAARLEELARCITNIEEGKAEFEETGDSIEGEGSNEMTLSDNNERVPEIQQEIKVFPESKMEELSENDEITDKTQQEELFVDERKEHVVEASFDKTDERQEESETAEEVPEEDTIREETQHEVESEAAEEVPEEDAIKEETQQEVESEAAEEVPEDGKNILEDKVSKDVVAERKENDISLGKEDDEPVSTTEIIPPIPPLNQAPAFAAEQASVPETPGNSTNSPVDEMHEEEKKPPRKNKAQKKTG
jgi:hypothetical protein